MNDKMTDDLKNEINSYLNNEVRKILMKKLIPTGAIASIIGILLGFVINESARSVAYEKAFDLFSNKVTQAAYDVGRAKQTAEISVANVQDIEEDLKELSNTLRMKINELEVVLNESSTANEIATELGNNVTFKKELLALLQTETKLINQRISGIKLVEGKLDQVNFACGGTSKAPSFSNSVSVMYGSRDGTSCGVQNINFYKELKVHVPNK